jgi:hypothetical protein
MRSGHNSQEARFQSPERTPRSVAPGGNFASTDCQPVTPSSTKKRTGDVVNVRLVHRSAADRIIFR